MQLLLIIISFFIVSCTSGNEIKWYSFEEGIQKAKNENKLIILDISAKWCHYCNLMETTTYSDKEIINIVNKHYIPIKVDADLRKDLNKKYNQGGLPTTAILTPDGELIYGNLYLPPDDMKKVLLYFLNLSKNDIERLKQQKKLQSQLPFNIKEKEVDEPLFTLVNKNTMALLDKENGGYDEEVKFPIDSIVYYLIIKTLENRENEKLLKKTLFSYEKLIDTEEGGIFRYATKRDWTSPHYEKLLRDQALLSVAFFNAYSILKERRFLDDANLILDFAKTTLYDTKNGYFYSSQGADIVDARGKILVSGEVYFSKKKEDRRFLENVYRKKPPLDETFYFSENALMVKSLIYSYIFNNNIKDLNLAENLMKKIIKEGLKEKGIIHTPLLNKYFLDTQINTLESLFTLYQITTNEFYLQTFKILLDKVLKSYYAEKIGLFTDYEDTGYNINRISYIDNLISLNFKLAKLIYAYQIINDDKNLEKIKNSIIKRIVNFNSIEAGLSIYLHFKPPILSIYVNPDKEFNNTLYSFFPYWNISFTFSPKDKILSQIGYPYEGYPVVYICSLQICFDKLKKSEISHENLEKLFKRYLNFKTM